MKRTRLLLIAFLMVLSVFAAGCASETEPEPQPLMLLTPEEGEVIDTLSSDARDFVKNYTVGSSAKYYDNEDNDTQVPVNINWDDVSGAKEYTLYIGEDEDLSDAAAYSASESDYTVHNLMMGTRYYWMVETRTEEASYRSEISYFDTSKGPRIIDAGGVKNIRDLGCSEIAYGKVFRSATLDAITPSGIETMTGELGIRTELDLRDYGEGKAGLGSRLGDDITYFHIPGVMYLEAIDRPEGRATMGEELRVFADEKNYPINVHCTYGKDRTGTIVIALKALMGVSEEEIMKDYELSMLSSGAKSKRSAEACIEDMQCFIEKLRGYGATSTSLSDCARAYMKACDLTDEEIDAIIKNIGREETE